MEVGWAGSAPHFIYTHRTSLTAPAHLLFAFFPIFCLSRFLLPIWSVLTTHLRAKYDAAVMNVSDIVDFPQRRRSQASCLDSFPSIDTPASGLALRTTPLLGVTFLLPALVTLGKSTSLETLEATRLLHGFYVDESSACYV